MDTLHPEEFEECSDYTTLRCSDSKIWKDSGLLSVTGCCFKPPAIQFEEGEEEWSSDTNSLLVLLRILIIELCNRSVTGVYSKAVKT